ncbi:hypothetical protein Avbf_00777 [Armadillidium vulgare]|nr:hypothetical protein Avbf_00777 [Armadillidium vulgare]
MALENNFWLWSFFHCILVTLFLGNRLVGIERVWSGKMGNFINKFSQVMGRKSTLPLVTLLYILSPFINGRGLVSRHSLQYGRIRKELETAATSTWLRTFYALSNFTYIDHEDAHINGPKLFSAPNNIKQITETVLFTVVRHPFTSVIASNLTYPEKLIFE